jgi:acyl-CoA thioester hydrolase
MKQVDFRLPIRIYWEDTDAGGVVYHASYVRFLERARSEYFRALGIEQQRLRTDNGLLFVVRDLSLSFVKPARLDDMVEATVHLRERRSASVAFDQQVVRLADGAVLVEARVRAACIDAGSFRPSPIPEGLFVETHRA